MCFGLVHWGPWETRRSPQCRNLWAFPLRRVPVPREDPSAGTLNFPGGPGPLAALLAPSAENSPLPFSLLCGFIPLFLSSPPFPGRNEAETCGFSSPPPRLSREPAPSLSLVLCEVLPLPSHETVYILPVVWKPQCLYLSL